MVSVTLDDHMAAGYGHRVGLKANANAVADCAASMSRNVVEAQIADLETVSLRCHVSTVRAAFLRDVLAEMDRRPAVVTPVLTYG